MDFKERLLENPSIYRLWSKNLDAQKYIALRHVLPSVEGLRVLDVGCGPATNSSWFDPSGYLGVDHNPEYIDLASKRFPELSFALQDASALDLGSRKFDLILVNSLLHHLTDEQGRSMLNSLVQALVPAGSVVINEPLIPQDGCWVKELMMRSDRGAYFRSHAEYRNLFAPIYTVAAEHPYEMRLFGVAGWSMVVFKLTVP